MYMIGLTTIPNFAKRRTKAEGALVRLTPNIARIHLIAYGVQQI